MEYQYIVHYRRNGLSHPTIRTLTFTTINLILHNYLIHTARTEVRIRENESHSHFEIFKIEIDEIKRVRVGEWTPE